MELTRKAAASCHKQQGEGRGEYKEREGVHATDPAPSSNWCKKLHRKIDREKWPVLQHTTSTCSVGARCGIQCSCVSK